jgi:hypothetical protein
MPMVTALAVMASLTFPECKMPGIVALLHQKAT